MKNISAKTWKIIAAAIIVVLIFVGLFYFLDTKGGNIITGNPVDVVEEFIEKWHVNGTLADKTLAEKISSTSGMLTRDFALSVGEVESDVTTGSVDSATCLLKSEGKVRPQRRVLDEEEGQATVYVRQDVGTGEPREVVFHLIASGGAWRINEVSCVSR